MDFLSVAIPQNESELAVMVSLLDAYGIQHYVHNQGFGGLYPGMQVWLYNDRRIMVPVDRSAEAKELLSVFFSQTSPSQSEEKMLIMDKVRVLIETCIFGWSFPTKRRKVDHQDGREI